MQMFYKSARVEYHPVGVVSNTPSASVHHSTSICIPQSTVFCHVICAHSVASTHLCPWASVLASSLASCLKSPLWTLYAKPCTWMHRLVPLCHGTTLFTMCSTPSQLQSSLEMPLSSRWADRLFTCHKTSASFDRLLALCSRHYLSKAACSHGKWHLSQSYTL